MSTHRQRRHALERPLDSAQVLAASMIVVSAATFYTLSIHELPQYMQLSCALLFTAQLLIVVILFMLISFLDPAHPAVRRRQQHDAAQQHKSQQQSDHHAAAETDTSQPLFLDRPSPSRRIKCNACRVFVSVDTRHCARCNKCIAGFDHHCAYLNTCIGTRNYPLFIGLLSCTILLVTTQLVVSAFALAQLLYGSANRNSSDSSTALLRVIGLCGLSLLPLLQLVCMLVLAAFHLYLWLRGIRTHEFLQRWDRPHQHRSSSSTSTPGHVAAAETDVDADTIGLRIHMAARSSDDGSSVTVNSTSSSNGDHDAAIGSEQLAARQQEHDDDACVRLV